MEETKYQKNLDEELLEKYGNKYKWKVYEQSDDNTDDNESRVRNDRDNARTSQEVSNS